MIAVPDKGGGYSPGYARHNTLRIRLGVVMVFMLMFDSQIKPSRVFFDVKKRFKLSCSLFFVGGSTLLLRGGDSSISTALQNENFRRDAGALCWLRMLLRVEEHLFRPHLFFIGAR